MRSLLIAAVVAGLVLIAPPTANAQEAAKAESLFKEGIKLKAEAKVLEDGGNPSAAREKLAIACDKFVASQSFDKSVSTQMNIADSCEKAGKLATAWEAYDSVAREVAGRDSYGKMGDRARDRAAALLKRLSFLTINVPDDVKVEGLEVMLDGALIKAGAWNTALPIDGGRHTISGRAPGHETWSTVVVIESETDTKQVGVPKFKELRALTGKTIVINQGQTSMMTPRRKVALGALGLGVAAAVSGVVFGLSSARAEDQASSKCPDINNCTEFEAANLLSRKASDRALYANIGFGIGGVAVASAVILWVTGRARERGPEPQVTAHVGPRGVSAAISLHF